MERRYDYIVVGAGTAGCAVANRLSQDPNNRVLLLEAGGRDSHPMVHVPLGFAFLMKNKNVNWCYQTEPEPELRDRRIDWPRGKVLGGSSSINGMVHIRGQREDFDHWASLGNQGWSYDELLPYFKRHEHNVKGSNQYRGVGGPLWVDEVSCQFDMSDLFVKAAVSEGLPFNEDFNGATADGVGYFQVNIKKGRRQSSAVAYLKPIRKRSNLSVVSHALATQILFDADRAVGVSYRETKRGGGSVTAHCSGEVILCGGTINSPQLLELSGIGDRAKLARCGIEAKQNLPGVGENLQDHLTVNICQGLKDINTYYEEVQPLRFLSNLMQYIFKRRGMLSFPSAQVGAFFSTDPQLTRPDAQIHFAPAAAEYNESGTMITVQGTTATVCYLRPRSRGSVHIQSDDPTQHPAICANYLSSEEDRRRLVAGVKKTRSIFASTVLADYRTRELLPGDSVKSDEEILDYIQREAVSVYHPVGTCKMGSDDMAVVDDQLRVRGLAGLRIADASVMPTILSGNTNAACIVIADKCADMILEDRRS
ncbi:MAG: choline dehydrogenase [bacterium]|nr:choline dehydrogenase [bacterium]